MDKYTLKVEKRSVFGRKVKKLRQAGILPVNVFGKNLKSESFQVDLKEFDKVFEKSGETGLVYLSIEGKTEQKPVLITNVQADPISGNFLHADFHQVDLKEKVTASVAIRMTGESSAEKQSIVTVVQYLNEIEVEALPTDLPDEFEVDVTDLAEVDQAIFVKDLKIDKTKVEIKSDIEAIVFKVEPPQKIEEVAPVAAPEGETPAGEVPAGEAAVPAEGQTEETPKEETK